ncbi:hypothetical protein HMPREF0663_11651 [Hoylesella oralis ATCC 33269]|uniref:Uncharacterized protein n=1 Tax=Hoylesella oralis ATCC 33269 TaxID=873533 RepID=E7RR50_9BACT|nr:hypothetical protein HMPREF0663_11651 [Hoylesella oralis ATCC 33269]
MHATPEERHGMHSHTRAFLHYIYAIRPLHGMPMSDTPMF